MSILIFLLYGFVLTSPIAFGLGALGGWLLTRWRDKGAARPRIYFLGALFGIVSGALAMPLLTLSIMSAARIVSRGPISTEQPNMFTPANPYLIAGGITGLVLGIVSAALITWTGKA